ncbi:MAG: hypothetical protein FGM27_03455 [Candidatus Omnitrophica bacterium]|nr:hypothetical protein [Candidatus Omnitrophota bacterium]
MGLAPVRSYEIYDIASRIRNALPGWKLPAKKDRASLTDSFFAFLKKELGGYPMKKRTAVAGTTADIAVSEEVVVEFSEDFTKPAHLEAMKARLEALKMWQGIILVVFCGPVSQTLRSKLDDFTNGLNNDRWYSSVKEIVTYKKS